MKTDTIYLVIGKEGVRRFRKTWPSLYANEIAIKMNLKIPKGLFRVSIPAIDLEIPSDAAMGSAIDFSVKEMTDEQLQDAHNIILVEIDRREEEA